MVTAGRHAVRMGDDHWAIYSQDGSLAAHFEFTVAVTADGPADPHPLAREPRPRPRPEAAQASALATMRRCARGPEPFCCAAFRAW